MGILLQCSTASEKTVLQYVVAQCLEIRAFWSNWMWKSIAGDYVLWVRYEHCRVHIACCTHWHMVLIARIYNHVDFCITMFLFFQWLPVHLHSYHSDDQVAHSLVKLCHFSSSCMADSPTTSRNLTLTRLMNDCKQLPPAIHHFPGIEAAIYSRLIDSCKQSSLHHYHPDVTSSSLLLFDDSRCGSLSLSFSDWELTELGWLQ